MYQLQSPSDRRKTTVPQVTDPSVRGHRFPVSWEKYLRHATGLHSVYLFSRRCGESELPIAE